MSYRAAGTLRLGFAVQLRLLPPQRMAKVIWIRLSSIEHEIRIPKNFPGLTFNRYYRPVLDGDWDLDTISYSDHLRDNLGFRVIYELFVENKPLYETAQYKQMEQEILTTGESADYLWFHTMEQVVEHLQAYEPIFNDMKENGYKSEAQQGFDPLVNELRLCIGRDGKFIHVAHGRHRVAMAKILGIEHVAVCIYAVHRLWAELCFKKYGGGVLDAIHKGADDIESRELADHGGIPGAAQTARQPSEIGPAQD
jgi:hypothetical protein